MSIEGEFGGVELAADGTGETSAVHSASVAVVSFAVLECSAALLAQNVPIFTVRQLSAIKSLKL